MSAKDALWHRLRGDAPPDADVDILLSERAWKTFEKLQRSDSATARAVWGSLDKLYFQRFWPPDNPNSSLRIRLVGEDSDRRNVYKFRAEHDQVRGFFRLEPSEEGDYLPQVLIDDFSVTHDEEVQVACAVLGRNTSIGELEAAGELRLGFPIEPNPRELGPPSGRPGTRYRPRLNVSYEDVENAISWAYSSVNIIPTADQIDSIASPAPILINGQAGTGKTSMLAIRAGFASRYSRQSKLDSRLLCTAYSRLVVDVLRTDVRDFMIYKLREPAGPEQDGVCQFATFAAILVDLLDDGQRTFYSRRERRVGFGRFNREFFQPRKTHRVIGNEVSAEFAWYAIRCFFKGYLDEDGPARVEDFGSMSKDGVIPRRLTTDLSPEAITAANGVHDQYAAWLVKENLFDDIDLARAAWKHARAKLPQLYDEIYLDEAQDLTRVEYMVLRTLLRPGTSSDSERSRIVIAGDPQQTIHPTGFNWRGIKAFFWQGAELKQTDLKVNHRTPQPIVDFANAIQRRRHHYGMEDLVEQEARTRAGLMPLCYQVQTPEDDSAVLELLRSPRPGTAVIVWAEDDDEVIQLLKYDKHINQIAREVLGDAKIARLESGMVDSRDLDALMASMRLHSVSEVKGLEFERVVLYKVGCNPAFEQYASYTVEDLPVPAEFEARIPILYHLNRLYVAITRSTRHLFIIDKPKSVGKIWSRFPEIDLSRLNLLKNLQTDPALSSDEHLDWTATGKQYLQRFHEERVARWLVHALTCFERARDNAEARALLVETRAELKEQDAIGAEQKDETPTSRGVWKEAGDLWDENPVFYLRAAKCYVKAEAWADVERVLSASPRLSPDHEGWYLYARLQSGSRGDERASALAYLDFLGRTRESPRNPEWVSSLSRRLIRLKDVESLIRLHGEICWSGNRSELEHASSLIDALSVLDRPAEISRFIERHSLQAPFWKPYAEAVRKLARTAEASNDWVTSGRLWKTVAQQAPDQETNRDDFRLAGAAYVSAALAGSTSNWADAAFCYGESGPSGARHRAICEAESAARMGTFLPAVRALASAISREWGPDGPLKPLYPNKACSEKIREWATKIPAPLLASDWEVLGSVVEARFLLEPRPGTKKWLREVAGRAGNRAGLAYRKLSSIEEEDQEPKEAALDAERAGDFERAWSIGQRNAATLTTPELERLEAKFLAWRYESQVDYSRVDADRAIDLLVSVGEDTRAGEVEALRLSREKDILEKVRLVLAKGANQATLGSAVALVAATPPSDRTTEARAFLIEAVLRVVPAQDRNYERIRSLSAGWLSDPGLQRNLSGKLSTEEYGAAVELAASDEDAKEFFRLEAGHHPWARDPYRRTFQRLLRSTSEMRLPETEKQELLASLERERAEVEASWAQERVEPDGPSGPELLMMRTTLEVESISKLRERCKEAGLPDIRGAKKDVLVELYLAYWLGLKKGGTPTNQRLAEPDSVSPGPRAIPPE